ncbi:hypothetical protein [Deinococcus sp. JMULE3]|uniref:hypothetical protein n=1 Tax=Deinococcus sp. JMULE3 TaxID=2518341 RepID=UPI0015766424|nr:hypothetical protein [Deinococcus sp. JMULE3]NTX99204.1 hypothetical protein [Deinococcus sp. JMULE3]
MQGDAPFRGELKELLRGFGQGRLGPRESRQDVRGGQAIDIQVQEAGIGVLDREACGLQFRLLGGVRPRAVVVMVTPFTTAARAYTS